MALNDVLSRCWNPVRRCWRSRGPARRSSCRCSCAAAGSRLDVVAVTFWAVGLAAATASLAAALGLPAGGGELRGAWAGSLLGALLALVAAGARAPRMQADLP